MSFKIIKITLINSPFSQQTVAYLHLLQLCSNPHWSSVQNCLTLTYHCFQNQFENPLYQFFIKLVCLKQCIVLDVILDDFS